MSKRDSELIPQEMEVVAVGQCLQNNKESSFILIQRLADRLEDEVADILEGEAPSMKIPIQMTDPSTNQVLLGEMYWPSDIQANTS